jgi:hypothetical protein
MEGYMKVTKKKSNVVDLLALKAKAKSLWPDNPSYQRQWLRKTVQLAGKHVLDKKSKVQWRDWDYSSALRG